MFTGLRGRNSWEVVSHPKLCRTSLAVDVQLVPHGEAEASGIQGGSCGWPFSGTSMLLLIGLNWTVSGQRAKHMLLTLPRCLAQAPESSSVTRGRPVDCVLHMIDVNRFRFQSACGN